MTTQDIFARLRVGLSLVVGFATGKFIAGHMQHHASEFFIGGFMVGVILTQAVYWGIDTFFGQRRSE